MFIGIYLVNPIKFPNGLAKNTVNFERVNGLFELSSLLKML